MSARVPWKNECPPEFAEHSATFNDVMHAPADALPAIEAALRARRQKALESELRHRLILAAGKLPLSRRVTFVPDEDMQGCYSDAEIVLASESESILLSVRDDVPEAAVIAFLKLAIHSIEHDDAMKGRTWDHILDLLDPNEIPF